MRKRKHVYEAILELEDNGVNGIRYGAIRERGINTSSREATYLFTAGKLVAEQIGKESEGKYVKVVVIEKGNIRGQKRNGLLRKIFRFGEKGS